MSTPPSPSSPLNLALASARRRVRPPAFAILGFAAATELVGLAWIVMQVFSPELAASGPRWAAAITDQEPGRTIGLGVAFAAMVAMLFATVGAIEMLRLRARPFAHVAAVLVMLPCSIFFPLGIPIGLWARRVLSEPEVRSAFDAR